MDSWSELTDVNEIKHLASNRGNPEMRCSKCHKLERSPHFWG